MAVDIRTKFDENDKVNMFTLSAPAPAGSFLTRDTTDTSVIGIGDRPFGALVPGSVSVAGDTFVGVLYYDVTQDGPSFEDVVGGMLTYESASGWPALVYTPDARTVITTDQYDGTIVIGASSGNTPPDSFLGVKNGKLTLCSAAGGAGQPGSVAVAKLFGSEMLRETLGVRAFIL